MKEIKNILIKELTIEECKNGCLFFFSKPLRFHTLAQKLGIKEMLIGQDNHPGFYIHLKEYDETLCFRLNYNAENFEQEHKEYQFQRLVPYFKKIMH